MSSEHSGRKKRDLCFCTTFGIINNSIFDNETIQWPKGAKEYFDENGKIDHPINTFNHSVFKECKKDISCLYQFDELINHYNDPLLKIGKQIASDVLNKSAIFLHFEHKDSSLLNTILEHRFKDRKDLFLFKECFHSMKFFTSRGRIIGNLHNQHDLFTIFILLCDDKRFRLRLRDSTLKEESILLSPFDIVVVTNGQYFDTIEVNGPYSNYILITYSASWYFKEFINSADHENRISKYKKFHENINMDETKILRGESIENQFEANIERVMEKHFGKTNISFFSDFEYDLPRDNLKKKISRLKWEQMRDGIENNKS